jgi:hypothetical protein
MATEMTPAKIGRSMKKRDNDMASYSRFPAMRT